MNVLLTNDDGYYSRGLKALVEAFTQAGHRAWVCAPDRQRSAAGHSATLFVPLHARKVEIPGAEAAWAVDGTPSDCARLGIYLTREAGIDLVVSGINRGMNQGGACVYSGTVAAALEAAMSGKQAMAVSLCTLDVEGEDGNDYRPAARLGVHVGQWLHAHPMARGTILNLNVPSLPWEEIRGIASATMAPVFLEEAVYEEIEDAQGPGFLYRNGRGLPLDAPDYDMTRTAQGYASITRLTWDMRLNGDAGELEHIGKPSYDREGSL